MKFNPNTGPFATPFHLAGVSRVVRINDASFFQDKQEEICKVAIGLTAHTTERVLAWTHTKDIPLSDCLLTKELKFTPLLINNPFKVGLFIRIQQDMETSAFLRLLNSAFASVSSDAHYKFAIILRAALLDTLSKGDEIAFLFQDNGYVTITKNDQMTGFINTVVPEVNRALLEAFVGGAEAISPDLCKLELLNK